MPDSTVASLASTAATSGAAAVNAAVPGAGNNNSDSNSGTALGQFSLDNIVNTGATIIQNLKNQIGPDFDKATAAAQGQVAIANQAFTAGQAAVADQITQIKSAGNAQAQATQIQGAADLTTAQQNNARNIQAGVAGNPADQHLQKLASQGDQLESVNDQLVKIAGESLWHDPISYMVDTMFNKPRLEDQRQALYEAVTTDADSYAKRVNEAQLVNANNVGPALAVKGALTALQAQQQLYDAKAKADQATINMSPTAAQVAEIGLSASSQQLSALADKYNIADSIVKNTAYTANAQASIDAKNEKLQDEATTNNLVGKFGVAIGAHYDVATLNKLPADQRGAILTAAGNYAASSNAAGTSGAIAANPSDAVDLVRAGNINIPNDYKPLLSRLQTLTQSTAMAIQAEAKQRGVELSAAEAQLAAKNQLNAKAISDANQPLTDPGNLYGLAGVSTISKIPALANDPFLGPNLRSLSVDGAGNPINTALDQNTLGALINKGISDVSSGNMKLPDLAQKISMLIKTSYMLNSSASGYTFLGLGKPNGLRVNAQLDGNDRYAVPLNFDASNPAELMSLLARKVTANKIQQDLQKDNKSVTNAYLFTGGMQ